MNGRATAVTAEAITRMRPATARRDCSFRPGGNSGSGDVQGEDAPRANANCSSNTCEPAIERTSLTQIGVELDGLAKP